MCVFVEFVFRQHVVVQTIGSRGTCREEMPASPWTLRIIMQVCGHGSVSDDDADTYMVELAGKKTTFQIIFKSDVIISVCPN